MSLERQKILVSTYIIFTFALLSASQAPKVYAAKPGSSMTYELEYLGAQLNTDLSVTFSYRVKSGANPQ